MAYKYPDTDNAYTLASLAGCASPDSKTSPGAEWLRLTARAWLDLATDGEDDHGTLPDSDALWDLCDSIVPIYTHEMWSVFVDLAAYNFEDGDRPRLDDIDSYARDLLYCVARALCDGLARETETDHV